MKRPVQREPEPAARMEYKVSFSCVSSSSLLISSRPGKGQVTPGHMTSCQQGLGATESQHLHRAKNEGLLKCCTLNSLLVSPQLWAWQPMMLCTAPGCGNVCEFRHVALRNLQGLPVCWFRSPSGPSLAWHGPPTPLSLFQP